MQRSRTTSTCMSRTSVARSSRIRRGRATSSTSRAWAIGWSIRRTRLRASFRSRAGSPARLKTGSRLYDGVFGKGPKPRRERGYHRLLVPLDARVESFDAFRIACGLAADDSAEISAVAVVEIPAPLPLDARFDGVEADAR